MSAIDPAATVAAAYLWAIKHIELQAGAYTHTQLQLHMHLHTHTQTHLQYAMLTFMHLIFLLVCICKIQTNLFHFDRRGAFRCNNKSKNFLICNQKQCHNYVQQKTKCRRIGRKSIALQCKVQIEMFFKQKNQFSMPFWSYFIWNCLIIKIKRGLTNFCMK